MASLVETIMSLEGLPSPPKTLLSVLAMLSDESAGLAEIGRLVVQNQGLTLLILRTANSSMYLGNVPVTGVREATARLGTSGMRRIVTAHLGGQLMSKAGQGYGLQSDEAQRGALAGALAAQLIAEERGLDQDLAFTAGLLRDCGKLALDHLIGVDRLREDMLTHTDGSQLEHEHLSYGFDHAEVGAALAMTWGLPDDIVRCIAHHHCPEPGVDDPLVDAIHVADIVCSHLGAGVGHDGLAYPFDEGALTRLHIDLEHLQGLTLRTASQLEDLERVL